MTPEREQEIRDAVPDNLDPDQSPEAAWATTALELLDALAAFGPPDKDGGCAVCLKPPVTTETCHVYFCASHDIRDLVRQATEREREACATVAASLPGHGEPVAGSNGFYAGYWEAAQDAAAAIRAREGG